ncbi:isoleucine--tRNA ligase [Candidatus Roizmanbacteria bacterium CG_4_10_14_0_8_um_filter_39_9]|uniref:Isoleucine--tRNA ligase n=1 Tax=Candidatus Roizmanbacteria bacterium CG_4_10_14_0_8_um_filter_39_9 TaxID=1974829 RepID=A0A2M7QD84_9BACT|nr:MAG: isoleucine--tRNA ligase [Candidatus Roizmanbacteria bacterium CG_4_10_14_0_8_um_filter_39_9]
MFKPTPVDPNFPELEKQLLDHWYKDGVVDQYLHKNDGEKKTFSFLDGPITANNPMGAHHAWGRTYKDLWPRFYNLLGYRQRFQNGFDCQGLWVEVEVEKELKLHTKKDIENLIPGDTKASIAKFVQLCKERVKKFSDIQTEQSKRLGYFADWEHSYFTMSEQNNFMIWYFLKTCHENGWIYKGHESVPWCPRCQTAISQHEMLTEDYKEVVHESVYVEFPIVGRKDEYLLVWTTTPWTIVANIAVAVDNNIEYSLVQGLTGLFFWIAKDLIETVFKTEYKKIVKTVLGKELVGLMYEGPFDHLPAVADVKKACPKTFHTVVATDPLIMPISTTEGTGMVHTAVSAGTEDFMLGKKLGLPMIPVIADDASYLPGFAEFSGKNAKKHPELIIDFLKGHKGGKFLFETLQYKHRYPACWRCKAELVWKVADEWYIAMDLKPKMDGGRSKMESQTLRERMIGVAKKIKWMPEFGLDRELDWLKNMHDWLISKKNRYWGLALPIYECKKCNTFEVIGSKEELKSKAVAGWNSFEGHTPHKPFIDSVTIRCSRCENEILRIDDVGNPWLDAGIVPYSTIMKGNQGQPLYLTDKAKWKEWFSADFITESFPGQFKNWFYAMIAMSAALENTPPYKRVLGYATMLGEDGRPMHKSWGNSIEFNEGADKIGADVMRWMFARQNTADNMLFGYKKADEVRRQFYLMLWNIYKFFVDYANLEKIDINKIKTHKTGSKNILDMWILARLTQLAHTCEKHLRAYDAKLAAAEIEKFVSDVSTWYIRRSRDRIWVNSDDTNDKEYFYVTLHTVLTNLSILISPFMPFISEIIYTNLTDEKSVHLSSWPKFEAVSPIQEKIITDMDLIRLIVESGQRARKEAKLKIRQPLLSVDISLPKTKSFQVKEFEMEYTRLLREELNVKSVMYKETKDEIVGCVYDTTLTRELEHEGKLRDLIRQIQGLRKEKGTRPDEHISLQVPIEFSPHEEYLKKRVLAREIEFAGELSIK